MTTSVEDAQAVNFAWDDARTSENASPIYQADFHLHSRYSHRPTGEAYMDDLTPYAILRQAMRKGLDVIAVTDDKNDEFLEAILGDPVLDGSKRIAVLDSTQSYVLVGSPAKNPSQYLLVLRGTEAHVQEGHLLVIGNERRIIHNLKYSHHDRIKEAIDLGAVVGPAHPANVQGGGIGREGLAEIAKSISVFEVKNGLHALHLGKYDRMAMEWYDEETSNGMNAAKIANSDAHRIQDIGCCRTLIKGCEKLTREAILNAVRAGLTDVDGKPISIFGLYDTFVLRRIRSGDKEQMDDAVSRFKKC